MDREKERERREQIMSTHVCVGGLYEIGKVEVFLSVTFIIPKSTGLCLVNVSNWLMTCMALFHYHHQQQKLQDRALAVSFSTIRLYSHYLYLIISTSCSHLPQCNHLCAKVGQNCCKWDLVMLISVYICKWISQIPNNVTKKNAEIEVGVLNYLWKWKWKLKWKQTEVKH